MALQLIAVTSREDPSNAVAQLCPECGLCCNGVLFGDVELQPEDDPRRLTTLGLELENKGKRRRTGSPVRFRQPCACFDGRLCRIYDERPARCRSFDCRLVQDVRAEKWPVSAALKLIREAARDVKIVRDLLQKLGQTDESLPLSRRCAKIISQPIDLAAGEQQIELRAELMLAIHNLTSNLQRNFLIS